MRPRRRSRLSAGWITALLGVAIFPVVIWAATPSEVVIPERHSRLELRVDGLDCAFWCPVGVDAALNDLPGLRLESVDTQTGRVHVVFDPDQVDESRIVGRIAEKWTIRGGERVDLPAGIRRAIEHRFEVPDVEAQFGAQPLGPVDASGDRISRTAASAASSAPSR